MACKCNVGLSNSGTACTPIADVIKKWILVEYFKADGSVNSVPVSTVFDAAFFSGKINNVDKKLRWYPLPDMKNVVNERAESIKETFNDGTTALVGDGSKNFLGLMINGSPQLLKALKSANCVDIGVFGVDKEGNLIGTNVVEDEISPIRIDKDSWSPRGIDPTDTTVKKIEQAFNYHVDEKDENLIMVTAEEMTASALSLSGLLDINASFASITTTGFVATLKTLYGTPKNPVLDKGLIITDFALYNVSDSLAGVITSVTESTAGGVYTFVFPAQGSGEVLRLTPTKTGRDYTNVIAATITIP